jgi:hypothetical protein
MLDGMHWDERWSFDACAHSNKHWYETTNRPTLSTTPGMHLIEER